MFLKKNPRVLRKYVIKWINFDNIQWFGDQKSMLNENMLLFVNKNDQFKYLCWWMNIKLDGYSTNLLIFLVEN